MEVESTELIKEYEYKVDHQKLIKAIDVYLIREGEKPKEG